MRMRLRLLQQAAHRAELERVAQELQAQHAIELDALVWKISEHETALAQWQARAHSDRS